MKNKSVVLNTIIAATLFTTSITVVANDETFKIAVIENAPESQEILEGDYEHAIATLSKAIAQNSSFDTITSLCVAHIKSKVSEGSESACTAAIETAIDNQESSYLRSISYNNRAIARYQNNDISGAMTDLKLASRINNNPMIKANLSKLKNTVITDNYETISAE